MTSVMFCISFKTISMKDGGCCMRISSVIEKCLSYSFFNLCYTNYIYKIAHLIFM